jgi:uncharacterized membrane protein YtjA (UPF0391 family)
MEGNPMFLDWTLIFLVLAIIAGFLGFSGVEFMSIEIARTLFYIFLVVFVISLIMRLLGKKGPM